MELETLLPRLFSFLEKLVRIPGQDYGSVLRFQSQRDEQQAYFNRNYHNLTTLATYFVDEGTDGIENWVQYSTCLSTISYDKNPSNDLYEAEEYLLSHIQKEKGIDISKRFLVRLSDNCSGEFKEQLKLCSNTCKDYCMIIFLKICRLKLSLLENQHGIRHLAKLSARVLLYTVPRHGKSKLDALHARVGYIAKKMNAQGKGQNIEDLVVELKKLERETERSNSNGVVFERLYHIPKGDCQQAMVEKEEGN